MRQSPPIEALILDRRLADTEQHGPASRYSARLELRVQLLGGESPDPDLMPVLDGLIREVAQLRTEITDLEGSA